MTPAFVVVFAVFVVALVVLAVISVRWGIRRDRASREAARPDRADPTDQPSASPGPGPRSWRRVGTDDAGSGRRDR